MNFTCHNEDCKTTFSANQLIGTIPPHVHLNAYCEPCFAKLIEPAQPESDTSTDASI